MSEVCRSPNSQHRKRRHEAGQSHGWRRQSEALNSRAKACAPVPAPVPVPSCLSLQSTEPSQALLLQFSEVGPKVVCLHSGPHPRGHMRKDSGLWERPRRQPRVRVRDGKANILASPSPWAWALEKPGPGSRQGGKWLPGPGTSPRLRALGQLRWPTVKASKGCAEQAGGPGWTGLPETEMREQKEAVVGWFGGSPRRDRGRGGEAAEGGLPGAGQGAGTLGSQQVWPSARGGT